MTNRCYVVSPRYVYIINSYTEAFGYCRVSREFYLNTEEFIDAVAQNLISKLQSLAVV